MKKPKLINSILPIDDVISIDDFTFDSFTDDQVDDIIAYSNKVSMDDLKIDQLETEVRKLREIIEFERNSSKLFLDRVTSDIKESISSSAFIVEEIIN